MNNTYLMKENTLPKVYI